MRYPMADSTALKVGSLMRLRRDAGERFAEECRQINEQIAKMMLDDLEPNGVKAPVNGGADMNTLEWVVE